MTTTHLIFRPATAEDLPELKELYVETIQEVCKNDYTAAEIAQWSSSANKTQRWIDLIETQFVLIAEIKNQVVGFASLEKGNYIDFFYIHKDFQRKGIALALLQKMEEKARLGGSVHLTSDISITARPFFEKHGYTVLARQENIRENAVLVNFKMKKTL